MTTLFGKNLKIKPLAQVMEAWIFFIVRAFIEALKGNQTPVIDVYDAVSMSVIVPLSEKSIRLNSNSVKIPDFTRGKWKTNSPIFGLDKKY